MATKNITPRADGEGGIGTAAKNWLKGFFKSIFLGTSGIVDSNSNEVLKPESVASAVNEITVKNAATGNPPEVKATGDDININFVIKVKGTGAFQVMDGAGNILATFDKVASAVNYITLLNSATAGGVIAKAVGADTDIDFIVKSKGVGKFQVLDGSDNEIAEFHSIASAVNFIKTLASVTGVGVTSQADGTDPNIDYIIKTKGVGKVQLIDGSDNEIIEFHTIANAVNYLKTIASATGVTLTIEAVGTDPNIDVTVIPKGTGKFKINGAGDVSGDFTFNGGSTLQKALSGDLVLECDPATAGTSAATLNAAAAGTFTKTITINLKDIAGNLHKWASLALTSTIEDTITDADVASPTRSDETPNLVNGTVDIILTYDTDAGVTKTYAAGETITYTVIAPTGGIVGYPVANATFVDTLIA